SHEYVGTDGKRPIDAKKTPPPKLGNLPFADYAVKYMAWDNSVSDKTKELYLGFVESSIRGTELGETPIANLAADHFTRWWETTDVRKSLSPRMAARAKERPELTHSGLPADLLLFLKAPDGASPKAQVINKTLLAAERAGDIVQSPLNKPRVRKKPHPEARPLNRPSYSYEYVGASGERPVDPKSL